MRVAAFTDLIGPDGVSIQTVAEPEPSAGEAVLAVEGCSINRHDLWILEGDSAMVTTENLPFISGVDVAGVVEAVGDGVDVTPGDRVVLYPNQTCGTCRYCRDGPETLCEEFGVYHGGLAEKALVDAARLIRLPESISMREAAALPSAYMTAWHMLRRADVTAGDLVFVPGATGGVGVATLQLSDVLGARTIGTSTSRAKLDRLSEIGADYTIQESDPEAIADAVTDIGEPDATINHLGGAYTRTGLRVLRRGGCMVVCGRTAGVTSEIDIPDLYLGQKQVVGVMVGTQGDLERLVNLVDEGAFSPLVDRTYDLSETDQAFADMQNRGVVGKLVITP